MVQESVYTGRKGKGLWRKGFAEEPSLSSEWNTERVREDASGDSEDGEDDVWQEKMQETVSDEACGDQWGVHSIDKVQHT